MPGKVQQGGKVSKMTNLIRIGYYVVTKLKVLMYKTKCIAICENGLHHFLFVPTLQSRALSG